MKGSPCDFRIGSHVIRPSRNLIEGDAGPVQVEPRLMRLLMRLAADAGQVVDRDRLLYDVWGERWVTDSSLNNAVAELRKALGETAAASQHLETVRGTGYRLLGVSPMGESHPWAPRRRPQAAAWIRAKRWTLVAAAGLLAQRLLLRARASRKASPTHRLA
ncbi:MAG: winged helix-turn-helix domain-containing protein [Acidobacteriota bacterium]